MSFLKAIAVVDFVVVIVEFVVVVADFVVVVDIVVVLTLLTLLPWACILLLITLYLIAVKKSYSEAPKGC